MTTSPILRRCYLLINTPTELARPIVFHIARTSTRNDDLYYQYLLNTENARKSGESRYLMSKNEIQKWTPYIPTGSRVQAIELAIKPLQWGMLDWNNPIYNSDPTLISS